MESIPYRYHTVYYCLYHTTIIYTYFTIPYITYHTQGSSNYIPNPRLGETTRPSSQRTKASLRAPRVCMQAWGVRPTPAAHITCATRARPDSQHPRHPESSPTRASQQLYFLHSTALDARLFTAPVAHNSRCTHTPTSSHSGSREVPQDVFPAVLRHSVDGPAYASY